MIVISLVLVIAAAVSLFIGLFIATETLTFIYAAIVLCLVSLLLLWLGTRQRKSAAPTSPSAPVYGGAARAGGSTTPARTTSGDELDELTSPDSGSVVRKTAARDRAATRVAASPPASGGTVAVDDPADEAAVSAEAPAEADEAPAVAPAPVAKKATKKATAKKATAKKATAKKSTKKAATKKSTAKKAAKKATKKSTAKKAASAGTSGAAARARLAQIAGVGPAKQDALLSQYGSLEGIRDASVDDIVANVRGFGDALASRVKKELSS